MLFRSTICLSRARMLENRRYYFVFVLFCFLQFLATGARRLRLSWISIVRACCVSRLSRRRRRWRMLDGDGPQIEIQSVQCQRKNNEINFSLSKKTRKYIFFFGKNIGFLICADRTRLFKWSNFDCSPSLRFSHIFIVCGRHLSRCSPSFPASSSSASSYARQDWYETVKYFPFMTGDRWLAIANANDRAVRLPRNIESRE